MRWGSAGSASPCRQRRQRKRQGWRPRPLAPRLFRCPSQDGPGGVLRRRPVVVFSSLRCLGEVVADVAEDVRNLAAKEDHRDDNGNGDDGDDECVFEQTLAFVGAQECEHYFGPPVLSSSCASLPVWRWSDN